MDVWWMLHNDYTLQLYHVVNDISYGEPFLVLFQWKPMNTLLSLDQAGTAPISDLELVNLYQRSLGELFKQDRGRMALMVRDMAEICTICGDSQHYPKQVQDSSTGFSDKYAIDMRYVDLEAILDLILKMLKYIGSNCA